MIICLFWVMFLREVSFPFGLAVIVNDACINLRLQIHEEFSVDSVL